MHTAKRAATGFTLIELLIVIGIIGFLAAAILVAVDPVKRIQDARNARRWAEVNGILNAILTKQVDDRAVLAGGATYGVNASDTLVQVIISDAAEPAGLVQSTCTDATPQSDTVAHSWVYLNGLAPTYIASIPSDPGGTTLPAHNSGYYFRKSTSGRITIGACYPEQGQHVSVTR